MGLLHIPWIVWIVAQASAIRLIHAPFAECQELQMADRSRDFCAVHHR
jgi:hypothetical protein